MDFKLIRTLVVGFCLVVGLAYLSRIGIEALMPAPQLTPAWVQSLPDAQKWKLYLYERSLAYGLSYADFRLLRRIGYCESSWRQYDKDGEVLRGYQHAPDSGLFQINTVVHAAEVEDPYRNIDYALTLYVNQGPSPWYPSKSCWNAFAF